MDELFPEFGLPADPQRALPARLHPRREPGRRHRPEGAAQQAPHARRLPVEVQGRRGRILPGRGIPGGLRSCMATRYFGERIKRNEDPRLLTGQAPLRGRCGPAGHAARRLRAQPLRARAHHEHRRLARARSARAWWPSTPPPTWATTGSPGRCSSRRRRSKASSSTSARRCRWQRTRSASPASRSSMVAGREPLHRRGRAGGYPRRLRAAAGRWSTWSRRCNPTAPLVHDDVGSNVAAHVIQTQGRLRRPPAPRPRSSSSAASSTITAPRRPSRIAASSPIGTPRRPRLTVWDTTQAPVAIRNGLAGHARSLRAPGARHRPVHRRRLRAQDHDVLPGGGADPLGCHAAQPPGQVDRGSRRELRRHHPRARPDPRRRDRADARTGASSAFTTSSCTTPAPTTPTA